MALGVARPKTTPIYYRVAAVAADHSHHRSRRPGKIKWRGRTRADPRGQSGFGSASVPITPTERSRLTASPRRKQMCDKPMAPELWPFDDVRDHWDSLVVALLDRRGRRAAACTRREPLAAMLPPDAIIAGFASNGSNWPRGRRCFVGPWQPEEAFAHQAVFVRAHSDPSAPDGSCTPTTLSFSRWKGEGG